MQVLSRHLVLLVWLLALACDWQPLGKVVAFSLLPTTTRARQKAQTPFLGCPLLRRTATTTSGTSRSSRLFEICNNDHDSDADAPNNQPSVSSSSSSPSLHPVTIQALTQALSQRAQHVGNADLSLVVGDLDGEVGALQVAIRAGKLAGDAIAAVEKEAAKNRAVDSNTISMALGPDEQQTIAGRVVGVVMRLDELQDLLRTKVATATASMEFSSTDDYHRLGVLPQEVEITKDSDDDDDATMLVQAAIGQKILDDAEFVKARSESLLALFLEHVETPQLAKAGISVPDQGQIDFLEEDRKQVLLVSLSDQS